jgi:exosortase
VAWQMEDLAMVSRNAVSNGPSPRNESSLDNLMLSKRLSNTLKSCWPVLICGLAGVIVFQCFGNATHGYIDTSSLFVWWVVQWVDGSAELQHAWILLILAVWLFRHRLDGFQPKQTWLDSNIRTVATIAMCFALLLHGLGFQMQQSRISIIALLAFVWGVLALSGGSRWARAAFFPLGLMLLAIPFGFLDSTGFWMRLWVVDASHALAKLAHLDVVRSGTQLFSTRDNYQFDVAAACSGIRSLQALLALSLVAGYLRLRSNLGRIIIFLLSFPLVYLGNVLRIATILFVSSWGGQKAGERVHDLSGFLVFAVVLGGLLGAIALLKWMKPAWGIEQETDLFVASDSQNDTDGPQKGSASRASNIIPVLVVLFFSINLSLLLGWLGSHTPAPRCGIGLSADGINPVELPLFIGNSWIGRRQEVSDVEKQILPPDTGYSRRIYHSLDEPGRAVFMSVVLSGKDRSSIHRPELCLVGQGWSIEGSYNHAFADPAKPGYLFPSTVLRVRRHLPRSKTDTPELVAYCFVGADTVAATQTERMWLDARSRLVGKAQRWAYILVQADANDGETQALTRIQAILNGTLPALLSPANKHTLQEGPR